MGNGVIGKKKGSQLKHFFVLEHKNQTGFHIEEDLR